MTHRITCDIPGRLRVRVDPEKRDPETMRAVRARLASVEGVDGVEVRHGSGSVLVNYDPEKNPRERVISEFREAGVDVFSRIGDQLAEASPDATSFADVLVAAVTNVNAGVGRTTGARADLRLMVPVALASLGVYRLAREGFHWEVIPGHVLLWYAFDSFWKLHMTHHHADAAPAPVRV